MTRFITSCLVSVSRTNGLEGIMQPQRDRGLWPLEIAPDQIEIGIGDLAALDGLAGLF